MVDKLGLVVVYFCINVVWVFVDMVVYFVNVGVVGYVFVVVFIYYIVIDVNDFILFYIMIGFYEGVIVLVWCYVDGDMIFSLFG